MRKELKKIGEQERHTFTAAFSRFGIKNGWKGDVPTVLFKNVKFGDKIVCDHLWFDCGKQFDALDLQCGDIVEFSARVTSYVKGYFGHRFDAYIENPPREDWKLERPTKVKKIGRNENPEQPSVPKNPDGTQVRSLDSHASRIEEARKRLRLKPPQIHAIFVDGHGKEIATANTEKEIWEKIGISESQWSCFFKGLVGTPSKGDEINLRFVKRRKNEPVPPYFKYGIKMEKNNRYGETAVSGYGFLRASYLLGWKGEHSPKAVANGKEKFDGMTANEELLTYIPLGALANWKMSVEGSDYWKTRYKERIEKIEKEPVEETKEETE